MEQQEPLEPRDRELAGALAELEITGPDGGAAREIWYRAGFEAGRRQGNVWRAVAAAAVVAAATSALWRVRPAGPTGMDRVVYVRSADARATESKGATGEAGQLAAAAGYPKLRDAVLMEGWDALPQFRSGSAGRAAPRAGSVPASLHVMPNVRGESKDDNLRG